MTRAAELMEAAPRTDLVFRPQKAQQPVGRRQPKCCVKPQGRRHCHSYTVSTPTFVHRLCQLHQVSIISPADQPPQRAVNSLT